MNNGIVAGRIYKELELRTTKNGKQVLDIPLAINNKKDDTTFISITCFDKMAETTYKYCQKGDVLGANFIIKNKNWEDESGKKHYDYSFIATKITYLHKKNTATQESMSISQNDIELEESDLPF